MGIVRARTRGLALRRARSPLSICLFHEEVDVPHPCTATVPQIFLHGKLLFQSSHVADGSLLAHHCTLQLIEQVTRSTQQVISTNESEIRPVR